MPLDCSQDGRQSVDNRIVSVKLEIYVLSIFLTRVVRLKTLSGEEVENFVCIMIITYVHNVNVCVNKKQFVSEKEKKMDCHVAHGNNAL